MMFCCEAPGKFCGRQNFARLSISMETSRDALNIFFYFWLNCLFKAFVKEQFNKKCVCVCLILDIYLCHSSHMIYTGQISN